MGSTTKSTSTPGAKEGHYAVTARPVIKPGSSVEYQTLDADETICVLCGEEVPFDDILIEGPVSSAQYRELSQLEGVEVEG